MNTRLAGLPTRPISERARPWAMAPVALALSGATLGLSLARPGRHDYRQIPKAAASRNVQSTVFEPSAGARPISAREERVSSTFLAGYLAYVYGHASAAEVHGATSILLRSLEQHPPRDASAAQESYPHVVSLQSATSSNGTADVSALVNDGGLIDYRVQLHLVDRGPDLLVSEVGQE